MPRHRLLLAAAALALLVLGVVRAGELARHGFRPTAHGEERWFAWAWGQPQERALVPNPFYVSQEDLPAGELVFLEVEAPGARESWLHVMAQYALPERAVATVEPGGAPGGPPPEAVVLRLEAPERVLPAAPPGRRAKLGQLLALAGGVALVGATGWLAAGPTAAPGWRGRLARMPLALPLGLSLAVPLSAVAILAGLPAAAGVPAALAVALGAALAWSRVRGPASATASANESAARNAPAWTRLFDGLLVLFLALFVVHTAMAPIWSWDHFAIWGVKARRIAAVGLGEQTFAGAGDAFAYAQGQYPLGLPLAWLDLSLGTLPSGWLFRAAHLLFGVAVVWLVRQAARTLGAQRPVASLAAALAAASPLLWDTESLGLAELPLALWAVAAVVLGLEPGPGLDREGSLARQGWPAGLLVGFLPWLKPEGWPLALLLAVALVLARRRRGGAARWTAGFVTAAVALAAASAVLSSRVPAEGLSFFAGDPLGRVAARLGDTGKLVSLLGTELLDGAWLGGWLLFAAGMALAAWRRRGVPLLLGAVVAVQLALYAGIYFATSLDPEQHVASSFFRISAALLPLALAAASGATERMICSNRSPGGDRLIG